MNLSNSLEEINCQESMGIQNVSFKKENMAGKVGSRVPTQVWGLQGLGRRHCMNDRGMCNRQSGHSSPSSEAQVLQ